MAKWATLEQRLFFWFAQLSGMSHDMSRAVFYSSKNFAGRADMVEAVTDIADIPDDVRKFLKAAIKKARQFNSFRNNLAHGEPEFDSNPKSPNYLQTVLVEGRHNGGDMATGITVETLQDATANIGELARLVVDPLMFVQGTFTDADSSPDRCREQIQALPHAADSKGPTNHETKG